MKHSHIGLFLSFEGGEGSGKSSQVTRLKSYLENRGFEAVVTREPGGSEGAEAIRELLLTGPVEKWDGITELLLLNAARRNHVETVIKPALAHGKIVICDRFADSTRAYQGFGHGIDGSLIERLHHDAIEDFEPDMTFLLDIDVETGINRALGRGGNEDRYEHMDRHFHEKLRQGFLTLARVHSERIKLIDADGSVDAVHDAVLHHLIPLLETRLKS